MMRCGQLSSYNQHLTGESLQVLQLQEAHQRRQLLMNRQIVDQTLLAVWTHLQKKLQLDQILTVFQLLKSQLSPHHQLRPQLFLKPKSLLLLKRKSLLLPKLRNQLIQKLMNLLLPKLRNLLLQKPKSLLIPQYQNNHLMLSEARLQ